MHHGMHSDVIRVQTFPHAAPQRVTIHTQTKRFTPGSHCEHTAAVDLKTRETRGDVTGPGPRLRPVSALSDVASPHLHLLVPRPRSNQPTSLRFLSIAGIQ